MELENVNAFVEHGNNIGLIFRIKVDLIFALLAIALTNQPLVLM